MKSPDNKSGSSFGIDRYIEDINLEDIQETFNQLEKEKNKGGDWSDRFKANCDKLELYIKNQKKIAKRNQVKQQ